MVNKIITIGIVIVLVLILILFSLKSSFSEVDLKSKNGSTGSEVSNVVSQDVLPTSSEIYNVFQFDSRYKFPTMPPVNPMVSGSIVYSSIPVSPELDPSIIGQQTNELDYSGGSSKLIKIPLQYNVDSDSETQQFEQLRSQDVLITPYNKIKYGTC